MFEITLTVPLKSETRFFTSENESELRISILIVTVSDLNPLVKYQLNYTHAKSVVLHLFFWQTLSIIECDIQRKEY